MSEVAAGIDVQSIATSRWSRPAASPSTPLWIRREFTLAGYPPGFHLITDEVIAQLPELRLIACGMAQVFIEHTSASLTLNENIAQEVLDDFKSWFDRAVPEDMPYWSHTEEGPDDMPAHIKTSLLGPSVMIPVHDGRLLVGRYQGIYLCEHRVGLRPRTLALTVWGETVSPRAGITQLDD